jgi:hypothetical protein
MISITTVIYGGLILIIAGVVGLAINDYITALPTIAILLCKIGVIVGVGSIAFRIFVIRPSDTHYRRYR